jgi:repressor LexA
MQYLTERQRDVLGFIARHLEEHKVAPTLQEIADTFGFASTASAQKHVGLLIAKGYLARAKHQKRGLVVTHHEPAEGPSAQALPLLGAVAAGSPIESIPDPESYAVPPHLVGSGEHYLLRVRGDSMIDDGIHDGDLVVVQKAERAPEGAMAVALVSGEVTLKRVYRQDRNTLRLQPANRSFEPIFVPATELQIQGVVVGLVRKY